MGGLQKFPVPRYVLSDAWVVNRQWKWHLFNVLVPSAALSFLFLRTSLLTRNQYSNGQTYVDPEDFQAPKKLVL